MNKQEIINKIIKKKEFSKLPKKDVELAFNKFDKESYLDEEKIKLTRDLLRKIYSGFTSLKLLNIRDKNFEWVLKKHLSTRERFSYYEELYEKLLDGLGTQGCTPKNISKNIFTRGKIFVIDLGAGVNGFSYKYFKEDISYIGVEAIGQLVELTNNYFTTLYPNQVGLKEGHEKGTIKNKIKGKAVHLSLFELGKIKDLIKKTKKPRIVFLFKTIDSLEMLERDYSKKLLNEITPLVDRVVVSFATRSMNKREKFKVNRNWIVNFIKENFSVLDDFELGGERYLVFQKK